MALKCLWSKINCCLFERLFKVKKNGVFLFGISFSVMEIFTFLYYANEESDDVKGDFTKPVQHSITNISRNIKAVIFKLGTRNQHHKKGKWHLSCCYHDNSYVAGPFLIKDFIKVNSWNALHSWFQESTVSQLKKMQSYMYRNKTIVHIC